MTKLAEKNLLANGDFAWEDATMELDTVSKIAWVWGTDHIEIFSKAVLKELNCDMTNDDFDSGLRRVLTQRLEYIDATDDQLDLEVYG